MNNRLYSHLYLHLKNEFTFKKSSTFANLLMRDEAINLLQQKRERNI